MTVVIDAAVVPRMWRGYDDPGLPVGNWIAHGVLIGDATGGIMHVQVVFKEEDQPSTGRFYSIEQYNVFISTQLVAGDGFIRILSFEVLGPFIIGDRHSHFTIDPTGPVFSAGHDFPTTPHFLGQESRLANRFSHVSIGTLNINVSVLSVTVQGYIWEARSVQAPGGLRRPVDSIYPR